MKINDSEEGDFMSERIIKAYMVLRGKTQSDMAKRLGTTVGTFNLKLNGKYSFTYNEMETISEELERPLEELFFTNSISKMKTKEE